MYLIAHRGNVNGPIHENENNPEYILNAINQGYDVEVDLRIQNGEYFLGHDYNQYKINDSFITLHAHMLWVHCKDKDALNRCMNMENVNYFWHQEDDYTLTSKNIIWAYPGIMPVGYTIMVMPELHWNDVEEVRSFNPYGICSDYVSKYIKKDWI